MPTNKIATGVVHNVPPDLKKALNNHNAQLAWNNLTPLARNEWICWIEFAKKLETRNKRIERTCSDILSEKRRPCCWPGCKHR